MLAILLAVVVPLYLECVYAAVGPGMAGVSHGQYARMGQIRYALLRVFWSIQVGAGYLLYRRFPIRHAYIVRMLWLIGWLTASVACSTIVGYSIWAVSEGIWRGIVLRLAS